VILVDTGPLLSLINKQDPDHMRCASVAARLPSGPMLTTWACLTEAMYLLGQAGGYRYQEALWKLREDGRLILHESSPAEADRMRVLMRQYQDAPMDLADASLVATAENLSLRRVFTIDGHFYAYRLADGGTFDIVG
jgi:predicted nucleic acid-binding protein